MFKVRITCFCPLLVLISGLISCSKDKEVQLKPDSFTADGLTVNRADRGYQLGGEIKTVTMGEDLLLLSVKDTDFTESPMNFSMETRCSDAETNLSYSKVYRQKNSAFFPVLKLLPPEILLSAAGHPVQCDFVMTAQNINTSTYISSLSSVQILGLKEFSNWTAPTTLENSFIYELDKKTELTAVDATQSVQLQCNDFGSIKNDIKTTLTLEDLVSNNLSTPLTTASQICRILISSSEGLQLSQVFQINMPFITPRLTTLIGSLEKLNGPVTHKAMSLLLENPNSFPITLRITNPRSSIYLFQPLLGSQRWTALGKLQRKEIHWRLEDNSHFQSENEEEIRIELPANKEIVLDALVGLNTQCELRQNGRSGEGPYGIIGRAFGFEWNSELVINPYPGLEVPLHISWDAATYHSPFTSLTDWYIEIGRSLPRDEIGRLRNDELLVQGIRNQWDEVCRDL
jgi:hypothetical protein